MLKLIERASQMGRLVETHASWVLLGDRFVYKLKKPVDLGFLDFSTLEKRRQACDAELALNSRLAANVYRNVVPVRAGPDGAFIDDAEGEWPTSPASPGQPLVEWAVKMRRLREEDRADLLLARGALTQEKVTQLAQLLARFHQHCRTDEHIQSFGTPEVVLRNVRENFAQMGDVISRYVEKETDEFIQRRQLGFIEDHAELLIARARSGRVRDGHGDLRLEHVYFETGNVSVIDCIEFNERFRYADVAADLAFLVMDLRHQGSSELAERLLSQYAEASADFELYRTLDFYEAYRAYVRGKVTALLDREKHDPQLAEKARGFFLHAWAVQQSRQERPRLIAVGGLIASGKSTLCRRLAERWGYPVIDTDPCRKRLAGLEPFTPSPDAAFEGLYTPAMTERVYAAVAEQASWVLSAGRSVIVEASFRSEEQRSRFSELARALGCELTFVWCEVPRELAFERLKRRSLRPSASDGRPELYDDLARTSAPPTAEEFSRGVRLDTSLPEPEQDAKLRVLGL